MLFLIPTLAFQLEVFAKYHLTNSLYFKNMFGVQLGETIQFLNCGDFVLNMKENFKCIFKQLKTLSSSKRMVLQNQTMVLKSLIPNLED